MSAVKMCSKCGEVKPLDMFGIRSEMPDGRRGVCIECKRAGHKVWRDNNREHVRVEGRKTMKRLYEVNPEKFRERSADFYAANTEKCQTTSNKWKEQNRDHVNQYAKDYRQKNPPQVKEALKRWREKNRDHVSAYRLRRSKDAYQTNPLFRLKHNIGCLIRTAIVKKGFIKTARTHEILGCDFGFFKAHVERQFHKGMTWDNRSKWHIDHIIPMASAKTEGEVLALNHFSNLRPMWAKDNLSKGAQITHLI